MLERMGVSTGVDLEQIIETARWLSRLLGKPVPSALARAGVFPAVFPLTDRTRTA